MVLALVLHDPLQLVLLVFILYTMQLAHLPTCTLTNIYTIIYYILSPIVANLYMEHLEQIALQTASLSPRLWLRYVDDTFVVWPHGQEELEHFHKHLNMQHQNIKFTVEVEEDNKLSFLNVQVTRNSSKLNTSVHRKTTHTDHYIPFHSHHHPRTVTGVMRCM